MGQLQPHRLETMCVGGGRGHFLSGCGTGWKIWAEARRSRTGHRSFMCQATGSLRKGWTLGCYFHSYLYLWHLGRRNPRAFPREQPFYFESPSPVPTKGRRQDAAPEKRTYTCSWTRSGRTLQGCAGTWVFLQHSKQEEAGSPCTGRINLPGQLSCLHMSKKLSFMLLKLALNTAKGSRHSK